MESATVRWSDATAATPEDPLGAVIAFYLSTEHRDEKMDGCPIVALGSDAARQGREVKASFEAGIKAHLEILGRVIADTGREEPNRKAMAILSTMVGAVTLSRVINDPNLAQALLDAAAQQVREGVAARKDDRPGEIKVSGDRLPVERAHLKVRTVGVYDESSACPHDTEGGGQSMRPA